MTATRHVVLVCGPPCAGKTTYVLERAEEEDLILDHDVLARAAGSKARWRHARRHRDAAEQAMRNGMDYIARSDDVRAWVIRSAPERATRDALARLLRADEVVVLTPDLETLRDRVEARQSYGAWAVVERWFERADAQA